jgi:hypothetical protein
VRSDELTDVRLDFAEWSEPIIADYLHEAYASRIGLDARTLRPLVTSHCRFWRSLLTAHDTMLQPHRRTLISLVRLAGIPTPMVDAIDVGVLDELMNVTLARFLRSPGTARDYGHYMLRVASHLSRAHTMPD